MDMNGQTMIMLTALGGAIVALATALGGVIRVLYLNGEKRYQDIIDDKNNQLDDKDKQLGTVDIERLSYRKLANDLADILEREYNLERKAKGLAAFKVVAAVEPQHNSPVTMQQQGEADVETLQKRVSAIKEAIVRKHDDVKDQRVEGTIERNTEKIIENTEVIRENSEIIQTKLDVVDGGHS